MSIVVNRVISLHSLIYFFKSLFTNTWCPWLVFKRRATGKASCGFQQLPRGGNWVGEDVCAEQNSATWRLAGSHIAGRGLRERVRRPKVEEKAHSGSAPHLLLYVSYISFSLFCLVLFVPWGTEPRPLCFLGKHSALNHKPVLIYHVFWERVSLSCWAGFEFTLKLGQVLNCSSPFLSLLGSTDYRPILLGSAKPWFRVCLYGR